MADPEDILPTMIEEINRFEGTANHMINSACNKNHRLDVSPRTG